MCLCWEAPPSSAVALDGWETKCNEGRNADSLSEADAIEISKTPLWCFSMFLTSSLKQIFSQPYPSTSSCWVSFPKTSTLRQWESLDPKKTKPATTRSSWGEPRKIPDCRCHCIEWVRAGQNSEKLRNVLHSHEPINAHNSAMPLNNIDLKDLF